MLKHFSATVYVVNRINGELKVLLHLHKKHKHWYGLGGHVESDEDPVEAAKREAKEEAGIDVKIFSTHPLKTFTHAHELIAPALLMDQDINGDHRHIDCIYFGTTADSAKVRMNEEFRWCSKKDIDAMDLQEDTRYIVKQAFGAYKSSGF
jgi:8-oxo-dGTP pyrophosphatase MutT (NUDIX family)